MYIIYGIVLFISSFINSDSRALDTLCDRAVLMAAEVGWPTRELENIRYIAYRESRCQTDASNPDDPMGGSYGLLQINSFWCKPTTYYPKGYLQHYGLISKCSDLYDLKTNLRSALKIYGRSGWDPWAP